MLLLPLEFHAEVVSHIKSNWDTLQRERYLKNNRLIECWLAYNGNFGKTWKNLDPYRSKRFLNLTFQAVESVASAIVEGTLPGDNWLGVFGRDGSTDQVRAKLTKALIQYQLYKTGFREQWHDFVKAACVFGTVPWCVHWEVDKVRVPDVQAMKMAAMERQTVGIPATLEEINTSFLGQFKTVVDYKGPRFEKASIFDFVQETKPAHPNRPSQIIRFVRPIHHLRKQAQVDPDTGYARYANLEGIKDQDITPKQPVDSLIRSTRIKQGLNEYEPTSGVELLEYHGDIPVMSPSGDIIVFENHVATVANDNTLVRFEPEYQPTGRSPWTLFQMFKNPMDNTYGYGVIEPILGLQDAINVRMNQVIDANELTIDPMLKAVRDGVFDIDNFQAGPGNIVEMSPEGRIEPLVIPNHSALGFNELSFLMGQLDEITGAQRSFSNGGTPVSATETSMVAGKLETRNANTLRHFENSALVPAMKAWVKNNEAFLDEPTWIRIIGDASGLMYDANGMVVDANQSLDQLEATLNMAMGMPPEFLTQPGPDGSTPLMQIQNAVMQAQQGESMELKGSVIVRPEDIAGDYDIMIYGASGNDSQYQLSQKIQLNQTIAQSPAAQILKWDEWARSLFEDAKIRGAGRFIKSRREVLYDAYKQFTQQLGIAMGATAQPGGQSPTGQPPTPSADAGMEGVADITGASRVSGPPASGIDPGQLSGPMRLP